MSRDRAYLSEFAIASRLEALRKDIETEMETSVDIEDVIEALDYQAVSDEIMNVIWAKRGE